MYTVRFYRREKNQWVYVYSKQYTNLGDIKETVNTSKLQAEVFDEFYEKIKVITAKLD